MTTTQVLAQLRHLYQLMLDDHVRNTAEAARGLLGPAIAALEVAETERSSDRVCQWCRKPAADDDPDWCGDQMCPPIEP